LGLGLRIQGLRFRVYPGVLEKWGSVGSSANLGSVYTDANRGSFRSSANLGGSVVQ